MSRLLTRIAKFVLRLSPAYPDADYLPIDQMTAESAMRLAHLAWEDERESGRGLLNYFEGKVKIAGEIFLDLGCGFGGRTVAFQQVTGGHYIGLEKDSRVAIAALRFARSMESSNLFFAAGVGELLPFAGESFDVVLCYDVLEHVQNPETTLAEVYRVLKPGGLFLAVFPPYFHPKGSHFDGYVSRVPYVNLMFPSRVLLDAVDEILDERGDGYHPQGLRPGDRLYTLNGLTIRSFRRMLNESNFETLGLEILPLLNRMVRKYDEWKMRYYACLSYPLSRVPFLQELFTHRIVMILRKPSTVAQR
jgi:ubiquinone/menaquinone biosynthesis C-methylase UbiE